MKKLSEDEIRAAQSNFQAFCERSPNEAAKLMDLIEGPNRLGNDARLIRRLAESAVPVSRDELVTMSMFPRMAEIDDDSVFFPSMKKEL